jgi:hypothetical protein
MAANRSALTEPVTRKVRCISPTAIVAIRIAPPEEPPPCFGDTRSRFR